MRPVNLLVLITISSLFTIGATAQLKLPFANPLQADVQKVVMDYPHQFKNLIGEEIAQTPQTTDYHSSFTVYGSEECSVTKYSSDGKEVYSWQALMLTTEDFEKAKKKFKALYNQLNEMTVHFEDAWVAHFKGQYEAPNTTKNFTTVVFTPDRDNGNYKKLRIELRLENELLEWKVRIVVFEKEREDDQKY
jgi:hypothetical protein